MRYPRVRAGYLAAAPAALLLAVALFALATGVVYGQETSTPPPALSGFHSELVVDVLDRATDFAFAPDGRIFVTTLLGSVVIYKDGERLPTPFVELPASSLTERGLMSLALDPMFETNGYVYFFYTYEHDPADERGPKTNRLVRFTADGDVALPESEFILLGTVVGDPSRPSCSDFPAGADCLPADGTSHIGGALRFSSDGMLFVGTGDASFEATNFAEMVQLPQNLDSLAGKILRINPDGSAPPDNPFYTGDPSANRSKVWSLGLRQPFRMGLQPDSDLPFVGDVGSTLWEEINVGYPGANFGWPCYEGDFEHPDLNGSPFCQDFIANDTAVDQPLYAYWRFGDAASVTAGVFYQDGTYPAEFRNAFFFGDWGFASVSILQVDDDNDLVSGSAKVILSDAGRPIDFEVGPDGDIYYLTSGGEIRHIRYAEATRTSDATGADAPGADASDSNRGIVVSIAAVVAIGAAVAAAALWYARRRRT
ncbi:MAG: PQQ-dependent sugar dehydrogenase [Chloroflexi bacterium]|nr:PQQ-dependent sugar dehydrogenase [Chloroflexota bacterium]MCI0855371.1 PQQ-dependent sugar dehydrogenase [Chloroflexota bacterium]MCI0889379.1 PQQ-dependent sugar dehydrogenase [Chloroflexota bacterium]